MIAYVVKLDHEADGKVRGAQENDVDSSRVRNIDRWRAETWVRG